MHQKKKTQNLGIYLTMEVKGLYTEHNKMLIKELEDYSKKWKDIPCFWFESINIVKMLILSKVIYKFSAILIKTPMTFFRAVEQIFPTFL